MAAAMLSAALLSASAPRGSLGAKACASGRHSMLRDAKWAEQECQWPMASGVAATQTASPISHAKQPIDPPARPPADWPLCWANFPVKCRLLACWPAGLL